MMAITNIIYMHFYLTKKILIFKYNYINPNLNRLFDNDESVYLMYISVR